MTPLAVFALTLLVAVLISDRTQRSVLSTAVLFLAAGLGARALESGWALRADSDYMRVTAEATLVAVLFRDGMKISASDLRDAWQLPGRALLFGMPLTMLLVAILAHVLVDVAWLQAFLLGAALAPTDPVLASAIVGNERIPERLRRLLNVESGMNDGLALPAVVLLIANLRATPDDPLRLFLEVLGGIALGLVLPWLAVRVERLAIFGTSPNYEPLFGAAVGFLLFALAKLLHVNAFLAAFGAGVTLASLAPSLCDAFVRFGEPLTELLKLAALLVFGALISFDHLTESGWMGLAFAVAVLVIARPVALLLALWRSSLPMRERLFVAWLGPKGFASVLFGILILNTGAGPAERLFHLVALAVAVSIVAHSSTDVLLANWLSPQQYPSQSRQSRREVDRAERR